MAAINNPTSSGPSRTTRQSAQLRSSQKAPAPREQESSGAEEASETEEGPNLTPQVDVLKEQIRLLQEQVERLTRQSVLTDRPLPTTETSPSRHLPSNAPENVRSGTGTPFDASLKLSERTPKIEPLTDGESPTFRQWQASIQDRLEINADHYRSERARMACVWGHTSDKAREYLEPQYLATSSPHKFKNAEEGTTLLANIWANLCVNTHSRRGMSCIVENSSKYLKLKVTFRAGNT